MIRPAKLPDLEALLVIEQRAFDLDRFSRRTFRYLLTKANATTLVDELDGQVHGYVMILFNTGTSLARLYSLAVDPEYQQKRLGHALLEAAEQASLEEGCIAIRLEVRPDNQQAIRFYEKHGYVKFGIAEDYYEDHAEALRYEKKLAPHPNIDMARVPYYEQTLEFTCGPSALMMAMHALNSDVPFSREQELRLWRESTTIFMTSGHGGCGPYGLALAAYHRGFSIELYVSERGVMFIDSVRDPEKKEVMSLVQADFIRELIKLPVAIHYNPLGVEELQAHFEQGAIPIVLISSYRMYNEKAPHWVVVTGFDEKYIYVHDPYIDKEAGKSTVDSMNMPIAKKDFDRMARYGKAGQKAALIVKKTSGT
jgi:ribosomal-protein-alanine acetyltransferase